MPNVVRLASAVFIASLAVTASASQISPKRVLIVYESEVYSPAALEFQQGILSQMRSTLGQDTEFFAEQLEANRFPESEALAIAWVRTRYAARKIDVVIFLGSKFTDVLPGIPTVYAGFVSPENTSQSSVPEDVPRVWLKVDFAKTIEAARRLQPNAQRILVIVGAGYEDHILLRQFRVQVAQSDIPIEYLLDSTVNDLLGRVAKLSPRTIVLPLSYTRDSAGNIYNTPEVVSLVARASTAPVYAVGDTTVGLGTVGGYVVDFERAGAAVADVVRQVVSGKTAAQIAVPSASIATYIFDARQLKRWGFSESDLPEGSIVQYKTTSAWQQYRWRILGVFALMLAQFYLILHLLSAQKKRSSAEKSLHDMTGRLLQSQDEERRRFARDLHDGTGQHLSAVALVLGQVLAKFPVGYDNIRELIQDSHSASRLALDEIRSVSFALHPPLLDGLGLLAGIRWYLDGLRQRTNLKIEFNASHEIRLLFPEAERALFRIVQESIGNVLRHSGGNSISIILSQDRDGVTLSIKDNGHGMSVEELALLEGAAIVGVGVAGMRERVRQLKGTFKIESSANGTRVIATVPIKEEDYAEHFIGR